MPDTDLQINESNVILSEADVISNEASVIPIQANDIPSEPSAILSSSTVILSKAKDLSPIEAPPDDDTLDLELEEELIIEDFTIDGICGVY
jgi:mycofactocin precursor